MAKRNTGISAEAAAILEKLADMDVTPAQAAAHMRNYRAGLDGTSGQDRDNYSDDQDRENYS